MSEVYDSIGAPLYVGDTVVLLKDDWPDSIAIVEEIKEGGIHREDTYRVLLVGFPEYVRPYNLVKVIEIDLERK